MHLFFLSICHVEAVVVNVLLFGSLWVRKLKHDVKSKARKKKKPTDLKPVFRSVKKN